MSEKLAIFTFFVFFFFCLALVARQELKNKEFEQKQDAILVEIQDLQKKARINAQDVDFLEKLVIEGKQ